MSALLWVEDFEGGQYGEFSHKLFGDVLGLSDKEFSNNRPILRDFMKGYQIIIKTNFAEAQRFINTELHTVDSIVLDIDLDVSGEDQEADEEIVLPLLRHWFIDKPESANEEVIGKAKSEMKKIAGYLLFVDLVMYKGFPADHILFCSNHAGDLESINKSFKRAYIEKPNILTKEKAEDIDEARNWIKAKRNDPYLRLRRGIIDGCQYLQNLIRKDPDVITFKMFCNSDIEVTGSELSNYLSMLEKMLPVKAPVTAKQRTDIYQVFLRSLAHEWNNVNPTTLNEHCTTPQTDLLTFGQIMKSARNWSAHSNKIGPVDEAFLAFLFLVNMRAMFKVSEPLTTIQIYEKRLMAFLPELPKDFNPAEVKKHVDDAKRQINEHAHTRGIKEDKFSWKVNEIYKYDTGNPDADSPNFQRALYQIFWINQELPNHVLSSAKDNKFLPTLARRVYSAGFL